MDLSVLIINILLGFNIIFLLSVIFVERKRPQSTIAWILVLTLLPVVGGILYLFFGSTLNLRFSGKLKKKYKNFDQATADFYTYLDQSIKEFKNLNQKEIHPYRDIVYMLLNQAESLYTNDNNVKLFTAAKEMYDDLFFEIKHARQTIHIEFFIIRNDAVGKKLVSLLAEKAQQGVEVRLLYDEFGSLTTTMGFFQPIVKAGGKVCRYFTTRFSNLLRVNHRNHRKIVVIDGKVGYTGGMNLGLEYMGMKKISPWRDTHLKLSGSCVSMMQIRFLLDWLFSSGETFQLETSSKKFFPTPSKSGNMGVQIVSSGPDTGAESIKCGYLKMINSAHKRIYIQTPYFVPDDSMQQCLMLAAQSGIDVRIMIPGLPDKGYVYAITLSYMEELLKCGAKVYLHPGFIHSKTIVIDSYVSSIGTTNFDVRSFNLNFEVNAFVYDRDFALKNVDVFMADASECKELTYESFQKRNLFRKMGESIFRLFAPLA